MKKLLGIWTLLGVIISSIFLSCDYGEKHDYGYYGTLLYLSSILWVEAISPPNGSIVPNNSLITIVFSENIDAASVTASTFVTSPSIPGTFSVVGSVVTLTPTGFLSPFTTYTVILPNSGITGTSGHTLSFPVQFFFTTN